MGKFICKRLLLGIFVLLGTSILIFTIARIVPGDVPTIALGSRASEAAKEALREELYLNDAFPIQYAKWLSDVLHGDFGNSFITKRPVVDDVKQFLPATVELAIMAGILMVIGTFVLGILSAKYKNTWIDGLIRILSYVGIAIPAFVVGILLLLLLGYTFPILPVLGRLSSGLEPPIAIFKKANNKQKRQTNAGNPAAKQNRVPCEPRQGAGPDFGLSIHEGGPSSWTTSSQWDSDRDCRAEGTELSSPFPPGPPGQPLHGESAYCPSQQCLRA